VEELSGLEDTLSIERELHPGDRQVDAQDRIGPYRLVHSIGEGGMGEVWLAEQHEPVRRRVALKIIKPGMDTKQVVARFESERQALALMDHPAIAKVFDGGTTAEGRPYFVMEYVPGVPITEHSDKHRMSTAERLELFTQVCDGVQHAHQKAVIHRDLKPSNILVSLVDGKAQPKIIDFGIAKATGYRLTEKTLFTELGAVIGTPEYMSPEQADSTGQDVDTRTDVYSLGVVLYQLLTGELPFGSQELRSSGLEELRRKLKETEPPRPSSKLQTLGETAAEVARERNTDPGGLRRQLEGDLDSIVLKSLEKERARRYGTATELAEDIRRHLRHEPVVARPASAGYRIGKYVRRHRMGVGVAAALAALLIVFAAAMTVQTRRTATEAATSKRMSEFLTGMFRISDPSESRGNSVTAREILDRAAKDVEGGLAKEPELQTRMMTTIGSVYSSLGLLRRAEPLLKQALETRRVALGPDDSETLRTADELGTVLLKEGRYPEAEKLMEDTIARLRRALGPENERTLGEMNNLALAYFYQGRLSEAERLHRQILEIRTRRLGPDSPNTLKSANNLAEVYLRENRLQEAEKLLRGVLEGKRRAFGVDHPSTLNTMTNLAILLGEQQRWPECEKLFRETVEAKRRVLGADHPDTLSSTADLGAVLSEQGKVEEGQELIGKAVESARRALGPDHPFTLQATVNLGGSYTRHGRVPEGERMLREALAIYDRKYAQDTPERATTLSELGFAALKQGQADAALGLLEDAVAHGLTPDAWESIETDVGWQPVRGDPRYLRLKASMDDRKKR